MHLLAILVCGAALASLGSTPAHALATYVYQGNPFATIRDDDPPPGSYDTSMRVTASITLPAVLPPNLDLAPVTDEILSATLSDGRQTFTDISAIFSTDGSGAITEWQVGVPFLPAPAEQRQAGTSWRLELGPGELPPSDFGQIWLDPYAGDSAQIVGAPGIWTLVPEPASALLLGGGLGLLGARSRPGRQRSRA